MGVVFLVIAEQSYSSKLAFNFLDDIIALFQLEVSKKYGSNPSIDVQSYIETIEHPYQF